MSAHSLASLMEGLDGSPSDLIAALQRVQEAEGYLSRESLRAVSRWLRISENEIYGVASFFAQFRFSRPGEHTIKVCLGTACHVKGGEQILDVFQRRLGVAPGEATADGKYQLERVACLGCCALAPVMTLDQTIYGQTSVLKVQVLLDERDGHENA
jgi:NADH:ubiquinone oxidoreductase subunit E